MRRKIFFFLLFTGMTVSLFSAQTPAAPLKVTVVTIEDCQACSTEVTEKLLRNIFSDISFERLDYRSLRAKSLIADCKGRSLPLFIFDKAGLEAQDNFPKFSEFFLESKSSYLLGRKLSGIFFFLDRPLLSKRIDLFLNIYDSQAPEAVKGLTALAQRKDMGLFIHFLCNPESRVEREECLRFISVRHLYPRRFQEYLSARLDDFNSSFWNVLMEEMGMDVGKVASFALSKKAASILKEDAALSKELGIAASPVILVENQKIFSVAASTHSLEGLLAERP